MHNYRLQYLLLI